MEKSDVLRIMIIDDNTAIHHDFIKILVNNSKQESSKERMAQLEGLLFDKKATSSEKKNNDGITSDLPEFEIETASQGQEGVEKLASALKEGKHYALAFVDIRMPPGWNGIETIKKIWELDSEVQIVICTAYSDYSWEETIKELGKKDNLLILKKPFDTTAVQQLACALTKKWQLAREALTYTSSLETRIQERTAALKKSLSVMRATLESAADSILVVDEHGKVCNINNKFLEMFNFSTNEVMHNNFDKVMENLIEITDNLSAFNVDLNKIKKKPDEELIGHLTLKDKRILEYYTQPYTLEDNTLGRVWSFRDITIRASFEEKLQYQATHDVLTGLPNRILLLDRLGQAIAKANRNKAMFAVLFLDLDRFKLINDSLGHEVGDEVLRCVAQKLQQCMRKEDTLVRLGGDEFVIVLEGIKNESGIINFCNQILLAFKNPCTIMNHELILSTSIGVSIYPKDGINTDLLLRNADSAMYHAKEIGTNQFQFYTEELNKRSLQRLEKEAELRHALEQNEFFLYYQPQFDLKTERLVSVEALLRWQHHSKGLILPVDFIPLAEETGLIIPIGEWVLRTACKQNKAWQEAGLPAIRVAVNVTTKQIRLFNFVAIVESILKETGLKPEYLELELTEKIIINNIDVINSVRKLKEIGVQISLDDFGTGYSSLNYLREIPLDRLKIDQSYIQHLESGRGDDAIVQAIIAMANSLNLEVLAEGVENKKQFEFLKEQKCAEVQGFYFSKPISSYECEKLLRDSRHTKILDHLT
jgi:diguanylate cyclase (GGDEF)-like protein/PAS domain S-box-containing protein